MSLYLDTSVFVCLFRPEPVSGTVQRWLDQSVDESVISDFGAAELSSVVSRDVRMGTIDAAWGRTVLADFDAWRASSVRVIAVTARDIAVAETVVRRFETKLGVPDALHLAVAMNSGFTLVTLDTRLAEAARLLGTPLAAPS